MKSTLCALGEREPRPGRARLPSARLPRPCNASERAMSDRRKLEPELASHSGPFPCLYDLLLHFGQKAPRRAALLAAEGTPISYGALLREANNAIRVLRGLGVARTDRVAVVLPSGPDAAAATVAVTTGAICVPLNPCFTASEWHRYFGYLGVAALVTRPKVDSSCRAVART